MDDFTEMDWNEPLGGSKEDALFVRVIFVPESRKILVFAIIQAVLIENKYVEIVRFDYSQNENLHVHKFYTKNNEKIYLDYEIDFSLIEMLAEQIRVDWRKNKLKFGEK